MSIYKKESVRLVNLFYLIPGRTSLTFDRWTFRNEWISLFNCSLIDNNRVLKETKNFVTIDNASANNEFADYLKSLLVLQDALVSAGKFFHTRCCAHILNLRVQDGLKEIDDSVEEIRESIKYVNGSQVREKKFLDCVNQVY